jgi:dTDP-4-dehydrorhamnose reductase
MLVNGTSVGALATAAKAIDALLVHYSTDYVFDGEARAPYAETAMLNPRSVYGASKLAGERAIEASGVRHLIIRTSWVYAPAGRNFPLTILRLARERDRISVVADQIGAPTSASLIAAVTAELIAARQSGIFHLAAGGAASWQEVAIFLVAEARAAGADLRLVPEAISAISTADYGARAPRPANSRLDTTKLRAAIGHTLPDWQAGIRDLVATLKAEGRL